VKGSCLRVTLTQGVGHVSHSTSDATGLIHVPRFNESAISCWEDSSQFDREIMTKSGARFVEHFSIELR